MNTGKNISHVYRTSRLESHLSALFLWIQATASFGGGDPWPSPTEGAARASADSTRT